MGGGVKTNQSWVLIGAKYLKGLNFPALFQAHPSTHLRPFLPLPICKMEQFRIKLRRGTLSGRSFSDPSWPIKRQKGKKTRESEHNSISTGGGGGSTNSTTTEGSEFNDSFAARHKIEGNFIIALVDIPALQHFISIRQRSAAFCSTRWLVKPPQRLFLKWTPAK
jgi:hypothetical protein